MTARKRRLITMLHFANGADPSVYVDGRWVAFDDGGGSWDVLKALSKVLRFDIEWRDAKPEFHSSRPPDDLNDAVVDS